MEKILTEEFINISKNKELNFTEEELQNIEKTAKVSITQTKTGFYLSIYCCYYESCCGSYLWKSSFDYKENSDSYMRIYSGFTANPIGRIEENYICKRPYGIDFEEEFEKLIKYMIQARKASIKASEAYCEYVKRTGDLS